VFTKIVQLKRANRFFWFALFVVVSLKTACAATATTNLSVSATVSQICSITIPTNLVFGLYDPVVTNASTARTTTGAVSVACTKGSTGLSIGMGPGNNASGGSNRMKDSSTNFLNYNIYQPPNNTPGTACSYSSPLAWGTTVGSNTLSLTSPTSKTARVYNICGSIPAGQDDPSGSYTDTVVATINF
jgi:spore coat protein U-like protein